MTPKKPPNRMSPSQYANLDGDMLCLQSSPQRMRCYTNNLIKQFRFSGIAMMQKTPHSQNGKKLLVPFAFPLSFSSWLCLIKRNSVPSHLQMSRQNLFPDLRLAKIGTQHWAFSSRTSQGKG